MKGARAGNKGPAGQKNSPLNPSGRKTIGVQLEQ